MHIANLKAYSAKTQTSHTHAFFIFGCSQILIGTTRYQAQLQRANLFSAKNISAFLIFVYYFSYVFHFSETFSGNVGVNEQKYFYFVLFLE